MTGVDGVVLGRRGHEIHVLVGEERIAATLRGRLKYRDGTRIVAGDRVVVTLSGDGGATVEDILPRRSVLVRRAGDARRAKPVAANIDGVLAVVAAAHPEPHPRLLDRLLVIAEANRLPVVVVVNKVDLDETVAEKLEARYRPAGYTVLRTSAKTALGMDAFGHQLIGRTSVLTGPSGVGKSSLLNAVEPGLGLRTQEVSAYWGTGRHTTVAAELIPIAGGGFVVDTPGFREVALWGVAPEDLPDCFPEIATYASECRFVDCRHLGEPECAVRAAALAGAFDLDRLMTYACLREEAEREQRHWE